MNLTMVYRGKSQNSPSIQTFHLFSLKPVCPSFVTICDIDSVISVIIFCSQRFCKRLYYEKMSSYWDLLTYYIIHLWIIYCIFVVQWYRNIISYIYMRKKVRLSYSFLIRWVIRSSDSLVLILHLPKLDPNLT